MTKVNEGLKPPKDKLPLSTNTPVIKIIDVDSTL
jgi:hypothetical protein